MDDLRAFGINADPWWTTATHQDEGGWRKTSEQRRQGVDNDDNDDNDNLSC